MELLWLTTDASCPIYFGASNALFPECQSCLDRGDTALAANGVMSDMLIRTMKRGEQVTVFFHLMCMSGRCFYC